MEPQAQQPQFEYQENPSTAVMRARTNDSLAARAEQQQAKAMQQEQAMAMQEEQAAVQQHNLMNSPEAQRKNAFISDKLRNGTMDESMASIAMIVMNDPAVHPQLKEQLHGMMRGSQEQKMMEVASAQPQPAMPQPQNDGRGLGMI